MTSEPTSDKGARTWLHRIGPGLVTACVVIGPGSITTSSDVGATHGYSRAWVVLFAVVIMMVFTTLGARLGAVSQRSTCDLVTEQAGRWLAVLIGLSVFFISAAFQFGNNLGVHAAIQDYVEYQPLSIFLVVVFNAVAIAFLFTFRKLYQALERLMMVFVAIMLIAFLVNLAFARPDLGEAARGFIPGSILTTVEEEADVDGGEAENGDGANGETASEASDEGPARQIDLSLLGLIGTTFVISAAFYQSYLVRQKGWGPENLADGLRDARIGSVIMALITLMLMFTAAAVLRGRDLEGVSDVARGLAPLFGGWGKPIFCLGLFAAAYSSFLVNSMIGGFLLSDGLGLGSRTTDLAPRILTAGVLLVGMTIAIFVIRSGVRPVAAIVAAQAVTVIASPLLAAVLLWLTNSRKVVGTETNGWLTNLGAAAGVALLGVMAWYTATHKVWPELRKLMEGG